MSDESREPETVPCCDRCYLRSGESIAMTWNAEDGEFECNRHAAINLSEGTEEEV